MATSPTGCGRADYLKMIMQKQFRYGLKFSKSAPLHFIGHLDLMRLLERAWRRAGLPMVYSAGYNPHPKMSLAQPLAVGLESEAEYLEFYLYYSLTPENIRKSLNDCLPPGIVVEKIFLIPERLGNLTVLTEIMVYEAQFDVDDVENIKKNIEEFLSGRREVKITLIRKGAEKDFILNPYDYIFELGNNEADSGLKVILKIKYHQGVPMQAREIVKAVCGTTPQKVTRKEIVFKFNFR